MGCSAGADNEDEWFEIENKRNRNDANCKDVMKLHPVDFDF